LALRHWPRHDIEKVLFYGIRSPIRDGFAVMPLLARPVPSVTERIPPMTLARPAL